MFVMITSVILQIKLEEALNGGYESSLFNIWREAAVNGKYKENGSQKLFVWFNPEDEIKDYMNTDYSWAERVADSEKNIMN